MSHSYYNKQWTEAQATVSDLLQQELPPEPPKPEKDRLAAFQLLATMYIKYIQIFRRLEQCYDQVVHPQKRRVLRHVLDGTIGRVLELKNEMVLLEFSEFHYFDDVLSDLKLTPNDVEMPIPKYFVLERAKALQEQEKRLGEILARLGPQDKEGEKEEIQMTLEEAIRQIQIHERARQGRLRAKFMREIRQQQEKERMAANRGAPTLDPDVAATRVQKLWKGFAQRKRTRREREDEMMFIGMVPPPGPGNPKHTPQAFALKTEDDRHHRQLKHEHEYVQALETIKSKIKETEGPDMKETMMDQIRQWFIECRDASGKFPEYPPEDEGGSAAIFKEKDPAEVEAELKAKVDELADEQMPPEKVVSKVQVEEEGKEGKGKKGKKDGKGKKKDKKKDKKGKGKKGKGGDDEEEDEGWKMAPSNFVPAVNEGSDTYNTVWAPRDEGGNFEQKHDAELIKEEKRVEVEGEIRLQVDELMRQELKNLKLAVDRDKGKKGKKGKSGKKKKKKKKSGKKGKKGKKEKDLTPDSVAAASVSVARTPNTLSERAEDCIEIPNTLDEQETWIGRDSDKSHPSITSKHHGFPLGFKGKKKEKDLTGNRTPGDLYEELVKEGIITRYPKVHLSDFEGEYSYLGTTLRQANIEPMPSLSDVRRLVAEYSILPLGSPAVHERAPLVKSMLLAGPRGTGKKMLVHCICTETGAVLFDLSSNNIADKYPGKDGVKMLMHMVFKVGRAYQPAVIYLGECEKMFKKKVPKTEAGDPKKLKKELPKALKTIKPEDRIMLVGMSRAPFDGEMKPMSSTYQKILMIPRPDYASRNLLWRRLIVRSGGVLCSMLDISSLSKITDGYTPGQLMQACQQVLTERRINQLASKPLQAVEFITPLATLDPVYKEEEEAFKVWYSKTPLGKKRAKAALGDEEEAGGKGKKGKGGKKGKKGKKKK